MKELISEWASCAIVTGVVAGAYVASFVSLSI